MKHKKILNLLFLTGSIFPPQAVNASDHSETQVSGYSATTDSSLYPEESEGIINYGDPFFRQSKEEYDRCWQERILSFSACFDLNTNGKKNTSATDADIVCGMAADRGFELCTTM